MTTINQADRISYSYSFKQAGGNIHLSYSTDVRPDETAEQAMTRAQKFVLDQAEQAPLPEAGVRGGNSAIRPGDPLHIGTVDVFSGLRARGAAETFNANNPMHLQVVEPIFRELGLNENRRDWMLRKELPGVPLGKIQEVVMASDAEYRARFPARRRGYGFRGRADA